MKKKTVEQSASISVKELREQGVFASDQQTKWNQQQSGGWLGQMLARTVEDQFVVIVAEYKDSHRKQQVAEATVMLSWSDCQFGGKRPWFLCPAEKDKVPCHRRVEKLYLSRSGAFMCRQCACLGYKSDQVVSWERPLHRAQKILRRLGGSGELGEDFPERPKGMHYDLYHSAGWQVQNALNLYGLGGFADVEARKDRDKLDDIPEEVLGALDAAGWVASKDEDAFKADAESQEESQGASPE